MLRSEATRKVLMKMYIGMGLPTDRGEWYGVVTICRSKEVVLALFKTLRGWLRDYGLVDILLANDLPCSCKTSYEDSLQEMNAFFCRKARALYLASCLDYDPALAVSQSFARIVYSMKKGLPSVLY